MLAVSQTRGYVVRRVHERDVPTLARVRTASWRETYRGVIPEGELARLDPARATTRMRAALQARRRGQVLLTVHEAGGAPFGYAWAGPTHDRNLGYRGEIYELYLHPRRLRRGAGQRLLAATLWQLASLSMWPVLVWVLADNPARHFYAACGGQEVLASHVEVGGARLARIGFAWADFLPLPQT